VCDIFGANGIGTGLPVTRFQHCFVDGRMPADQKGTIVPDRNDAPVSTSYDPACRRCPRLASFLAQVKREHPLYWCKPVPPFGARTARLVIVGLAPGMHGANASGRPFTGDYAGILLYATLHAYGFATQAVATGRDDGLRLVDCRITNAVKCLPPANKPVPVEVRTCNDYLAADLASVPEGGAILALGRIAHEATLRALALKASALTFAHGATHALHGGRLLVDSYHCSRYNTNTRRLTPTMFQAAFDAVVAHLARAADEAA
jgi:uracil-DNA glycosylase family 4